MRPSRRKTTQRRSSAEQVSASEGPLPHHRAPFHCMPQTAASSSTSSSSTTRRLRRAQNSLFNIGVNEEKRQLRPDHDHEDVMSVLSTVMSISWTTSDGGRTRNGKEMSGRKTTHQRLSFPTPFCFMHVVWAPTAGRIPLSSAVCPVVFVARPRADLASHGHGPHGHVPQSLSILSFFDATPRDAVLARSVAGLSLLPESPAGAWWKIGSEVSWTWI